VARRLSHERGDFDLFARLAVGMLDEREFFIRKAIGWVLREVSKKRSKLVFEFLRAHRDEVSGLTLREGAKYLPAQRRTLRLPAEAVSVRREKKRLRRQGALPEVQRDEPRDVLVRPGGRLEREHVSDPARHVDLGRRIREPEELRVAHTEDAVVGAP
jgi:hypothetical protein